MCNAHDALEAERDYGEAFMRRKRERGITWAETRAKSFRVREANENGDGCTYACKIEVMGPK